METNGVRRLPPFTEKRIMRVEEVVTAVRDNGCKRRHVCTYLNTCKHVYMAYLMSDPRLNTLTPAKSKARVVCVQMCSGILCWIFQIFFSCNLFTPSY